MPTIGFLNFGAHTHVIRRLHKISTGLNLRTVLFSTVENFQTLQQDGINPDEIFLIDEQESLYRYLCRVEEFCGEEVDFLVNVGLHTNIKDSLAQLRFRPDCVSLILINNANAFMGSGFFLDRSSSLRKNIGGNIDSKIKRQLLSNYSGVIVEFDSVKQHVKRALNYDGQIDVFNPVLMYQSKTHIKNSDIVKFVIPGNISRGRREYELALSAFESAFIKNPDRLELCLLGRMKDDEIADQCDELQERGYPIQYYESWIPSNQFVDEIQTCDVVFLPQNEYKESLPKERYGLTSGTGGVFEAIRHAKPIIVPNYFPDVECFGGSDLRYTGYDELTELVSNLVTDPDRLLKVTTVAEKNAKRFTLAEQQTRFRKLLQSYDEPLAGW